MPPRKYPHKSNSQSSSHHNPSSRPSHPSHPSRSSSTFTSTVPFNDLFDSSAQLGLSEKQYSLSENFDDENIDSDEGENLMDKEYEEEEDESEEKPFDRKNKRNFPSPSSLPSIPMVHKKQKKDYLEENQRDYDGFNPKMIVDEMDENYDSHDNNSEEDEETEKSMRRLGSQNTMSLSDMLDMANDDEDEDEDDDEYNEDKESDDHGDGDVPIDVSPHPLISSILLLENKGKSQKQKTNIKIQKNEKDDGEDNDNDNDNDDDDDVRAESEFHVTSQSHSSPSSPHSTGINLSDLLNPLRHSSSSSPDSSSTSSALTKSVLLSLKKKLKVLESDSSTSAISAPLSLSTESKAIRQVEYKEAKKDLNAWSHAVDTMLNTPNISYPIRPPTRISNNSTSLSSSFHPSESSPFELEINHLISSYSLDPQSLSHHENSSLQQRQFTPDEIANRHSEISKLKSLIFFHENKLKRIKKIKSKTFRKLAKKRRERESEKSVGEGGGDIVTAEEQEQRDLKSARERAKERMTLQHSNSNKWIQRQKRVGMNISDYEKSREAIEESLKIQSELKKKMSAMEKKERGEKGKHRDREGDSDGEEDNDSDSEEDNDEDGDVSPSHLLSFGLSKSQSVLSSHSLNSSSNSLTKLKFMMRAEEKNQREAEKFVREFEREVEKEERAMGGGGNEDGEADGDEENMERGEDNETQQGRRTVVSSHSSDSLRHTIQQVAQSISHSDALSYAMKSIEKKSTDSDTLSMEKLSSQIRKEFNVKTTKDITIQTKTQRNREGNGNGDKDETQRQWDEGNQNCKKENSQKTQEGKETSIVVTQPIVIKINQEHKHSHSIPSDDPMIKGKEKEKGQGKGNNKIKNTNNSPPSASLSFDSLQSQLVSEAFYSDESETKDFSAQKALIVDLSMPKFSAPQSSLPGWGSWGGKGFISKKDGKSLHQQKKESERREANEEKKKQIAAGRKDSKLSHVIINEKKDHKVAKFTVSKLPFPFTSIEQYEETMDRPIGVEWNTDISHRMAIKPKVIVKTGEIIETISKEDAIKLGAPVQRRRETDKEKQGGNTQKQNTNQKQNPFPFPIHHKNPKTLGGQRKALGL